MILTAFHLYYFIYSTFFKGDIQITDFEKIGPTKKYYTSVILLFIQKKTISNKCQKFTNIYFTHFRLALSFGHKLPLLNITRFSRMFLDLLIASSQICNFTIQNIFIQQKSDSFIYTFLTTCSLQIKKVFFCTSATNI